MDEQKAKELGVVYTPPHIARFLVKWAIRKPMDTVLDGAAGEGIFIQESINQLLELGASKEQICSQVFGIEYDSETYYTMLSNLAKSIGIIPTNLWNIDFFDAIPKRNLVSYTKTPLSIPLVDAVVGNPPYVERQRLKDLDKIRKKVLNSSGESFWLSNLTDIYGYFLIHSARFLKPNGRLAFIVSDTWLNMRFGVKLKEYLVSNFKIKAIVGFRERVFPKVLVRTILLLIEKGRKSEIERNQTQFIQLRNSKELDTLSEILNGKSLHIQNNRVFTVPQKKLDPNEEWSIYLKSPKTYNLITQKPLITCLSKLANSAIGIQTLAKGFYILRESELKKLRLEETYFKRIAVSPRDTPFVIEKESDVEYFILYCDKTKEELRGTALLQYIEEAEKTPVTIRGKTEKVIGFNNVPRLKKAGRKPWYNLKSNLERHERAPILLPRRAFQNYRCIWNKAKVVENENFIRIYPKEEKYTLPLLAFLNSSLSEFLMRVQANIYGGGVYDLRPKDVKRLKILDLSKLQDGELKRLESAYREFLKRGNRSKIDAIVFKILDLRKQEVAEILEKLSDLQKLSMISKG